ncbi:hypothetical protein [Aeoliella mucimassa]|uniref:Uncharacterized protein n=1 Tax=Aeoliella mucimassa TaxID=2527972 RepID=A0A518AK16_9BACT|nr:hypothetical protein [Aeoliella mucimassa]QDU55068.1 hypothetical protein Pan181_12540 [Aeoliella mucimassa]
MKIGYLCAALLAALSLPGMASAAFTIDSSSNLIEIAEPADADEGSVESSNSA